MRNRRYSLGGLAAGIIVSLNSCAYDPSYSISGYSSSGDGYWDGYGYGYGGGSVSTSIFVSTGNPRWAYDPSCFSYYDRSRRCYYDPVLCAYYPSGHRPSVCRRSHPHGWHRGSSHCPPPARVRDVCISRDHLSSAHAAREHRWNNSWLATNSHNRESHHNRSHGNDSARVLVNTFPDRQKSWLLRDSANRNPWETQRMNPSVSPAPPSTTTTSIAAPEPPRRTRGWAARTRETREDSIRMGGSFSPPASGSERLWNSRPRGHESTNESVRPPSMRGFGNTTRDVRGSSQRAREATVPPPTAPTPDA
jgi:hypothetical protein